MKARLSDHNYWRWAREDVDAAPGDNLSVTLSGRPW
jgi:hypothetical protein